ncbi:MAG: hypothetical protein ACLFST_15610 [Spirochaetia bacterium]
MKMIKGFSIIVLLLIVTAAVSGDESLITLSVDYPEKPENPILLKAVYRIPENRYQTDDHDFFTFRILEPELFKLTPVSYPEGTRKNGEKIYTGETVLTAGVILPEKITPGEYILSIEAGYQFCSFEGDCFFPQKKVVQVSVRIK